MTGERIKEQTEGQSPKFQDVFGKTLVELAEKNKRIVGVTPAMPTGCSMTYMMERFPDRFPIIDFYLQTCHRTRIYGLNKPDLRLLDVGKVDTLAAAEQFLNNPNA